MNIRQLKTTDSAQVYDAFTSANVNLNQNPMAKSGFYEYRLTEKDIEQRIKQGTALSLIAEERGKLIMYGLGYLLGSTKDIDTHGDLALEALSNNPDLVYMDQLFVSKGIPAYDAGRFLDIWTMIIFNQQASGIAAAIPQKPWKNQSSTRIAIDSGFRRYASVCNNELELGIFAKPLWTTDKDFPRHFSLRK